MVNIFKNMHIVKNFPEPYPAHRKFFANIVFFLGCIIIKPWKEVISSRDIAKAKKTLKKGDVLLLGNLTTVYGALNRTIVTHSALYIGNNHVIHSIVDGVECVTLDKLFQSYNTLAIARMPATVSRRKQIVEKAIRFAKQQVGKPYDFRFKEDNKGFFCTKLVNKSFKSAGYNTGLKTFKTLKEPVVPIAMLKAFDSLHPMDFPKGKFDVVFVCSRIGSKEKLAHA